MDIELFEKVENQLIGLYTEVSVLSKKKPDDAINLFKLKIINSVITHANNILGDERPFTDFESFDADAIPSNSDVVVTVSQYINCMEKVRSDNITYYANKWFWVKEGRRTEIRTAPPKKIAPRN